MCRKRAPRAVIAGSSTTSTFRDSAMRCGVGDGSLGELVDEAVALDQQRRHAIGQVELRRGKSLRLVRPADVIGGDLRAVHDDLVELVAA